MERHVKHQHEEFYYESQSTRKFRNIDGKTAASLSIRDEKYDSNDLDWPGFTNAENELIKLVELKNKVNFEGHSISPNPIFFQQVIDFYKDQPSYIISNCWFVRKDQIQGFSGYICEKCNFLELTFVRNIGYDKIAGAGHKCNMHEMNRQLINPQKGVNTVDDLIAHQLMALVRNLNPNIQYLMAEDISKPYSTITEKSDSNIAKMVLGIGHRYFLHTLREQDMPVWMTRIVTNIGNKIVLSEPEMIDFFKMTKSTFAIIEILTPNSTRMIEMRLMIHG